MLDILMCLITIVSIIFLPILLAFIYQDGYWERKNVPGPKRDLIMGNLRALINPQNPSTIQLSKWTKEFGKIYGIREGWHNVLIVSDLEMIREFLVKKFDCFNERKMSPLVGDVDNAPYIDLGFARGARWKKMRELSTYCFTAAKLKQLMPTIDDSICELLKHLEIRAIKDEPFNIARYFQEVSIDIICRIALGQRESKLFKNPYLEAIKRWFGRDFVHPKQILALIIPSERVVWFLKRVFRVFLRSPIGELLRKVHLEVESRKKIRAESMSNAKSSDFMDFYLDVEEMEQQDDQSDQIVESENTITRYLRGAKNKKLTTKEIVSQCVLNIRAGFHTTSATMSGIFFYLAKNPSKQQILQTKIDELNLENFTYEELQELKYTDAVIKETLRLLPPSPYAVSRRCRAKTVLGDIEIDKGVYVQADVLTIHYDKEIWGDDAENFVPERWLSSLTNMQKLAWMSFGMGPRTCIGMRLAYMELKLTLIRILQSYTVLACQETEWRGSSTFVIQYDEQKKLGHPAFNQNLKLIGGLAIGPEAVTIKLKKRHV